MSEEELERTGMISKVLDDDVTMEERLEEILDNLEYNDFPIWKKNQINGLIEEIQKSKKQEEKEKKFFELIDLIDD
ncbi:MAG: hypothetical protein IJA30_02870 [Bacilli bacterium]|nr:hypothetical protein [Bacilli bacterium]